MTELFMHMDHAPAWVRAADQHADWESIFAGYTSTVDHPGCAFWREPMVRIDSGDHLHR
jgi:hypothetical protein